MWSSNNSNKSEFFDMLRQTVSGCGENRLRSDDSCGSYEGFGRFRFEPSGDGGLGHFIFEPGVRDSGGFGQCGQSRETFSGFGVRDPNPCCRERNGGGFFDKDTCPPGGLGSGESAWDNNSWIWIILLIVLSQQNAR